MVQNCKRLNAHIDRTTPFIVAAFVVTVFFAAWVSFFIFAAAVLVGFFGFGRLGHGGGRQGCCDLNDGHSLCNNVLGHAVAGNDGWRYRWNLHNRAHKETRESIMGAAL